MTSLHISTSLKCERLAILGVLGKLGLVFYTLLGKYVDSRVSTATINSCVFF